MPELAEAKDAILINKQSFIKTLRDRREIGLIIFTLVLLGIILIFKPNFLNKGNITSQKITLCTDKKRSTK